MRCLDCTNARAFPRHLPFQLLTLDRLKNMRASLPLEQWISDYAGRAAQLEDILGEYEPAELDTARAAIEANHRRVVDRLFERDLDSI